jgi:hypothetical protein
LLNLEESFMKKLLIIGSIVALVMILVGGAGLVFAKVQDGNNTTIVTQTNRPNGGKQVPFGYGPGGMMNGYGYRNGPGGMMGGYGPGGMMGGRGFRNGEGFGIMHDYMISAFASAVGLSVDEVNTRLANGATLTQIANAQGFTGDKLTQLITQVRKSALDQAVAAGLITQAQADRMLERMNDYSGPGFGPGFGTCPMWDGDEVTP